MPSLPPPRTTELYYDGAWHDISGDMRESATVRITRGVTGLGARQDPTAATATLDNRSGAYSPRNPLSPLFGRIGRNTPWRFSVDAGGPYLDLPAGTYHLSTPDRAALDIPGDLDVRMDLALNDWGAPQMLAARYDVGGQLAWTLETDTVGRLVLRWSPTGLGADKRFAVSPALGAAPGQRLRVRATLDVNNGASGCTTEFWVAYGQGMWMRLGSPVVSSGTTSLFNATAPLHIGDNVISTTADGTSGLGRLEGRVYGLEVYAGIGGTLRTSVGPEDQAAAGGTTFTDGTGAVWTLSGAAALSDRHTRMVGEIPAWPPSRDLAGADRTVQIAPAGIMRRLGAGNRPLDSALRRFIIGAGPVECWPLTDGEQATQGSSLLGSPPAGVLTDDPPVWGKGSVASWVEPTILCPAGEPFALEGRPRTDGATNSWSIDFVRAGGAGFTSLTVVDSGRGTDDSPQTMWQLLFNAALTQINVAREVRVSDSSTFSTLATITPVGIFNKNPHHIRLTTIVGSSSTTWLLYLDGALVGSGSPSGLGRPVGRFIFAGNAGDADLSIGYVTVWAETAPTPAAMYTALQGFPAESAGARALRLSAENGVPAALAGLATESEPLGVQEPQRFLEALDTIAAADLGLMLEQRDALALVYRARTTLYNQLPTLELDFANGEISAPFSPVDDDKLTENDVTVRRRGGASSAPAVQEDGPLSVDAIGRYDVSTELSLAADEQTTQQAWWRLHVGTFDGLRYTKITVNLANPRAHAKVSAALTVDVGDLIRLQNVPADQRPGDVDLIVTGYDEEVGATAWTITYTCVPGEPWAVGVVDDSVPGRADTAGSELAAPATSSAPVLSVATTSGPIWISSHTVLTDNPSFESNLTGWTAGSGTAQARVATPGVSPTGGSWSARLTPNGAATTTFTTASLVPTPAGTAILVQAWVRCDVAREVQLRIAWRDAAAALVLLDTISVNVAAGAWTWISETRTAPAGTTQAGLLVAMAGTPPASHILHVDLAQLAAPAALAEFPFDVTVDGEQVTVTAVTGASSPQQMTVTRSVNGIVKSQVPGADVRLTHPMIIAL
ncbi:hypothetical protein ACFWMT_00925 [Streptomyces sp. NPDC058368]|uniref:hypothetical protein n=1 Tax=Streptomyces sp. NPDC058368 TaxID=3346461 RepID=UPI0036677246